jgi:5S rRNA maturation endonuclease (ribonuclease M5)
MTVIDFNTARRQGDNPTSALTADAVRARLNQNPQSFLEWLYAGRAHIGKKEARIGNVYGKPGASLKIDLHGEATGLWHDKATGEGGDLISLYRAFMGYKANADFALSLKEIAKDFLNESIELERPQWHPGPKQQIEKRKAELGTKPRADMLELGAPVAEFRYFDLRNNIIASVVRYEPDGTRENKTFRPYCYRTIDGSPKWGPGAPDIRPLYRLPDIATQPTVVLCEGEGKAEALARLGIPATTAMQGANAPIDKTDWTPLQGKTVIIWPDKDGPGFKYANSVAQKLTTLGCRVMTVAPPADKPNKWDAADCVAEGGDAGALIGQAVPYQGQAKQRINLLDIDEIENLPPPSWLVDSILTENGLSVLWGRSGAMKSFVALDIALCVATGAPWHGKAVKQGLVVYVAAEGSHGLGRRAVGWRRTRGKDLTKPDFKLIPHSIAMTSSDLDALVERILTLETKPALIVIDTLARTFGQGDENKQADMNAYVSAADKLREATSASIMIIHHSGVHEDRRERGSNVLRGAADTVIKVARKDDKLDIINQAPEGKQKDAEEFKTIKLRTQKVHFTQAEAEQSTLILNLRDETEEGGPEGQSESTGQRTGQRAGKNEQLIIASLKRLGGSAGFMRLRALTNMNSGSLTRALENLVEKQVLTVGFDNTGNTKIWDLI